MTVPAGSSAAPAPVGVTLQPYQPSSSNNNQSAQPINIVQARVSDAPVQYAIPDVEVETWLGIPLRNKRKDRLIKIVSFSFLLLW